MLQAQHHHHFAAALSSPSPARLSLSNTNPKTPPSNSNPIPNPNPNPNLPITTSWTTTLVCLLPPFPRAQSLLEIAGRKPGVDVDPTRTKRRSSRQRIRLLVVRARREHHHSLRRTAREWKINELEGRVELVLVAAVFDKDQQFRGGLQHQEGAAADVTGCGGPPESVDVVAEEAGHGDNEGGLAGDGRAMRRMEQ